MHGKVKWFSDSNGYGYIERENGPDVFVHYTNIVSNGRRTLKPGDRVEFEIVQDATDRPQAVSVVVVTETGKDGDPAET